MIIRNKPLKPVSQKAALKFWAERKKKSQAIRLKLLDGSITTKDLHIHNNPRSVGLPNLPAPVDNAPVYVLIRTSHRPKFFKRCYESVRSQTYRNIVVIVHSDDPRNDYVTGDIIIHGRCFHPKQGSGTYNLYNNRLLDAIPPGWGWYHIIDDDDMYYSDKAISQLVKRADPNRVNVARVKRWGTSIWPKNWRRQRSFQTECFFVHSAYKKVGRWWGNRGGDHYYSRQLTNKLQINWIDNLIVCKAQEGKGHGKPNDLGKTQVDYRGYYPDDYEVPIMIFSPKIPDYGRPGQVVKLPYREAFKLDKKKLGRITYYKTEVIDERKPAKQENKISEQTEEAI